jgi:hypothetical protein
MLFNLLSWTPMISKFTHAMGKGKKSDWKGVHGLDEGQTQVAKWQEFVLESGTVPLKEIEDNVYVERRQEPFSWMTGWGRSMC